MFNLDGKLNHLTVELTFRKRFKFDKAGLVELKNVLQVRLVKTPPEDAAVLPIKDSLLVDL